MAEYIERGALMQFPIRRDHYDRKNGNKHFINGIESVLEYAENLPAADVAPVVHGKWLRSDDDWDSLTTIRCSVCGEEWCFEMIDDVVLLNYKHCPNCGAKMDEEEACEADIEKTT